MRLTSEELSNIYGGGFNLGTSYVNMLLRVGKVLYNAGYSAGNYLRRFIFGC